MIFSARAQSYQSYVGRTAVDPQRSVIGRVDQVYTDGQTGQPAWISLRTGAAGATECYAPLHGSVIEGDAPGDAVSPKRGRYISGGGEPGAVGGR